MREFSFTKKLNFYNQASGFNVTLHQTRIHFFGLPDMVTLISWGGEVIRKVYEMKGNFDEMINFVKAKTQ